MVGNKGSGKLAFNLGAMGKRDVTMNMRTADWGFFLEDRRQHRDQPRTGKVEPESYRAEKPRKFHRSEIIKAVLVKVSFVTSQYKYMNLTPRSY